MQQFERQSEIDVPVEDLFAWHARPGAFERLAPPWERLEILEPSDGIEVGARVVLRMGLGPLRLRWVAEHTAYEPPHLFQDVQRSGPFALWEHTHRFEALADGRSRLIDSIRYALAPPLLGQLFGGAFTRARLDRTFAFRHARTRRDLELHRRVGALHRVRLLGGDPRLGAACRAFLSTGGHELVDGPGDGVTDLRLPGAAPPERPAARTLIVCIHGDAPPEDLDESATVLTLPCVLASPRDAARHSSGEPWISLDDGLAAITWTLASPQPQLRLEASSSGSSPALGALGFEPRDRDLSAVRAPWTR